MGSDRNLYKFVDHDTTRKAIHIPLRFLEEAGYKKGDYALIVPERGKITLFLMSTAIPEGDGAAIARSIK